MSAEALLREVEEKLKRDLAQLEAEYSAKMEELRRKTEEETRRVAEEADKLAKQQAEKEKTKILGSARLQAKRIVAAARQGYVERGLQRVVEALKKYSQTQDYRKLLSRMLEHARSRLGKDVRVRCRPQDRQVFEKLGAQVVAADLQSVGGAVFESADGSLQLDLRFEELMRLRAEELRSAILEAADKT